MLFGKQKKIDELEHLIRELETKNNLLRHELENAKIELKRAEDREKYWHDMSIERARKELDLEEENLQKERAMEKKRKLQKEWSYER